MKIIRLAAVVLLPALVGFLASYLYSSGALIRWHQVASPTEADLNYLAMTAEDPLHFYADLNPDTLDRTVVQACDRSGVEFSLLTNRPKNAEACVQIFMYHIDGMDHFSLIRDADGQIWQWHYLFTAIKEMGNVFWPVVGLILGLILLLIFRKRM